MRNVASGKGFIEYRTINCRSSSNMRKLWIYSLHAPVFNATISTSSVGRRSQDMQRVIIAVSPSVRSRLGVDAAPLRDFPVEQVAACDTGGVPWSSK